MKKAWNYIKNGKLRILIWAGALLLGLYALYFLCCFRTSYTSTSAENSYWSNWQNVVLKVIMSVLAVCVLTYGGFLIFKKKMTVRKGAAILGALAAIVIVTYSFGTPIYDYGGTWNQHDLYYDSPKYVNGKFFDYGSGHHGIIMTIYKTGQIPGLIPNLDGTYRLDFSGLLERYQPKLFYIISALFMKFNSFFLNLGTEPYKSDSIFTVTDWALFEQLRILYTFMEIAQIYVFYRLFKALRFDGVPLLVGFGLLSAAPIWCYFANWANNDGMCFFFGVLALLFTVKFIEKFDWISVVLIAVFIGLSMSCKLGGALIAIAIAPFLIYAFVKAVKLKVWKKVLIQAVVFALIVFPLGLFWPVYNYVKYGQPILFFSAVPNDKIYIHNESFFERFILFPNGDLFKLVWVYHSYGDSFCYQDTSLITALIKTTLYGEYGFGHSAVQMGILLGFGVAVYFAAIFSFIYLIIRFFLTGKKPLDLFVSLFLLTIFLVGVIWEVKFVNDYPYTCNEDIRYIPMILISIAGIIALALKSFYEDRFKHEVAAKTGKYTIICLSFGFIFMALLAYLSVCPWYYR